MNFNRFIFLIIFSFQAFAFDFIAGIEEFSNLLNTNKLDDCLELLDNFESKNAISKGVIQGLRSSVFLAKFDFIQSKKCLEESVCFLAEEGFEKKVIDELEHLIINISSEISLNQYDFENHIKLIGDEFQQPKGVKIRYWFGIAQIAAGMLLVPFSSGISTSLILSGVGMTASAAADAVDNKEYWEKNLNERQNIGREL